MIRRHGHSILCNPNLGTLTRKPKPRADKQALGHAQPQTEAKGGESTDSQPSQAAILASRPTQTSGSPEGKDSEETAHWTRKTTNHQAPLQRAQGQDWGRRGLGDKSRMKSKVLKGTPARKATWSPMEAPAVSEPQVLYILLRRGSRQR